ncbi:MAG: hypothetical protein KY457_01525 [Actinobacteria bacterium]|nr:hypothetical protein [Actinomycetota bacterium]
MTVHASWRGLAAAVASPLVLLGFAVSLLVLRGPGPVAIVALVLGLALATVTLLDYPRRTEFAPDGVHRVCMLRRHVLPWPELVAIERTGGSAREAFRRRDEHAATTPRGGLVARGAGKRRFLLTDRVESRREFDELRALLGRLEVPTVLRAGRPSADAPPTDLYRRTRAGDRQDRP